MTVKYFLGFKCHIHYIAHNTITLFISLFCIALHQFSASNMHIRTLSALLELRNYRIRVKLKALGIYF